VLGDAQLKAFIVGKAFWVRNDVTSDTFSVSYTVDGDSMSWHIGKYTTLPSYVGNPMLNGYQGATTPYKIEGGKLVTKVAQDPYSITIYKLGDTYYGARSNEFGYANYEMIPSPQFVLNPMTAALNQFSIELGLTEQQRQQVFPIIQQELPKLEALKKNTSLKPMEKLEQLKQIADDLDSKITPLLNADQQKQFQEIREQHRRALIEKIGSQIVEKAQNAVSGFFDQHAQKAPSTK
jgi:hypothetical protein